jgi:hypothetical protein
MPFNLTYQINCNQLQVGKVGLPPLLEIHLLVRKSGGKPTFLTTSLSRLDESFSVDSFSIQYHFLISNESN